MLRKSDRSDPYLSHNGLKSFLSILIFMYLHIHKTIMYDSEEISCGKFSLKSENPGVWDIRGSFLRRQLSIDKYHVKKYVKESQFLLFSRKKVYKNVKFVYIT